MMAMPLRDQATDGRTLMPRKLPPNVERNQVKGHTYLSFRIGKGLRIRLPNDPTSPEFREAYAAAMAGEGADLRPTLRKDGPGTIGALLVSYMKSREFVGLRSTSKAGYMTRLETIRTDHGHRPVAGLTRDRIVTGILQPFADRPGAALDTLKKLRILIHHAIDIGWLKSDPSAGIKRPKTKEIRSWTDAELATYERRWPIGTKQRTGYELMLNVGSARSDTHRMTWTQIDVDGIDYTRRKTGVPVAIGMVDALRAALDATPRSHVTIINTEFGRPFTVDGFSGFIRDAIRAAGLPLDCKPHGLRKTLGRRLADAGVSAHDIMAALGHTTLQQAENYTREADRRRGGTRAVLQLNEHRANKSPQTAPKRLGKPAKKEGKTE
jgi:enterobacteria phage integrase